MEVDKNHSPVGEDGHSDSSSSSNDTNTVAPSLHNIVDLSYSVYIQSTGNKEALKEKEWLEVCHWLPMLTNRMALHPTAMAVVVCLR